MGPEEAMSVKHGVPRSVREIVTAAAEAERNEDQEATGSCAPGDSVRTVGRLKTVLSLESVVIEDEGHELEVNVSLSTPCGYKAGSRYQFIGELDRRRNGSGHGVSPPRIHLSGSLSVRAPPHSGSLTIVSLWRGRSRRRRFW